MRLGITVNYLFPPFSFGSFGGSCSSVEEEKEEEKEEDTVVGKQKLNYNENTIEKKMNWWEQSVLPPLSSTTSSTITGRSHNEHQVLKLSNEDVNIDFRKPLGEGGFCIVYPVKVKHKTEELALKKLRLGIIHQSQKDKSPFITQEALQDLNHEVQILKTLSSHENIIHLHGYHHRPHKEGNRNDLDLDFFIVLDKLKDTLDCRFDTWEQNRGYFTHWLPKEIVQCRLREIVMGIAKGMEYIHSKDIMFRDLKPANIGFDSTNCVKILDFGLAIPCNADIMGPAPFRGKVGTLRYMAPEVANNLRYGLSADVYSFSILLWQICTSRLPYEEDLGLFDNSLPKNKRPSLQYIESKEMQTLLKAGWDFDPMNRPTFHDICLHLKKIITTIPNDNDSGGNFEEEEEEEKENEDRTSSLTTTTITSSSKATTQQKQQEQKMKLMRKTSYFLSLQQQQLLYP